MKNEVEDIINHWGKSLDIELRLKVVAGKTEISLKQLSELTSGSVLEFDYRIGDKVDICLNDVVVARGRLVLSGGKVGVELTEFIADGETDEI